MQETDPEITKLRPYEEGYLRGSHDAEIGNLPPESNIIDMYSEGYIQGYYDNVTYISKNCLSCRYSTIDKYCNDSDIYCVWIGYPVYRRGICEAHKEKL